MTTTIDIFALLVQAGIERLREGPKEIVGECPQHAARTGHRDRRPSWSINRHSMRHQCFSCGYRGTLTSLLVDLTGEAPPDLEIALQTQDFLHRMADLRAEPEETLAEALPLLTDWAILYQLVDVPDPLLQLRSLRREAIDRYEVRWDPQLRHWVLPLRTLGGELLGAQYRKVGSVLTLPAGLPKSSTLFGLSQMTRFDRCALVESPLDAVRLFGLGIPAVAALGAWVSAEQALLLARQFDTVYLALDNDDAGRQGAEICAAMLRRYGTAVVPWIYAGLTDCDGKPAKDPGDVDDDDALRAAWERTRRFGL